MSFSPSPKALETGLLIKSQPECQRRQGETSQLKLAGSKRDEFLLPPPFVLFRSSRDLMRGTHIGEGIYFTDNFILGVLSNSLLNLFPCET